MTQQPGDRDRAEQQLWLSVRAVQAWGQLVKARKPCTEGVQRRTRELAPTLPPSWDSAPQTSLGGVGASGTRRLLPCESPPAWLWGGGMSVGLGELGSSSEQSLAMSVTLDTLLAFIEPQCPHQLRGFGDSDRPPGTVQTLEGQCFQCLPHRTLHSASFMPTCPLASHPGPFLWCSND